MNHWFFGEILGTFFSVQYVGEVKKHYKKTSPMWPDVTKRIWLCSHLSHWFSLESVLRGSSHGLVIYVVIFLRTWVGTSTGTRHMFSCPVPIVMLWVLTMCSHANVVGLYGYMVCVCLIIVRELVWVTTWLHVVNVLTNSSHIFQSDDFEVLYSLAQWVSVVI
jgi:hypothetical protein